MFGPRVAALALAALAVPATGVAQSTYLSGQDDETFRAMELTYDPVVILAARAHFEGLERLLNNHAPIDEIVTALQENAVLLATELFVVDEGCALLLMGRMAEVTAYSLDDRAMEDPGQSDMMWEAARGLFEAAAMNFQSATDADGSVCVVGAVAAVERRPAPAPEPEPEPEVGGRMEAYGGTRVVPDGEGSGD